MHKPKIIVTSAAGHTGYTAVLNLLEQGFPVRAFVHRRDARAQALENAGAEVFCGDLFDFRDIRAALMLNAPVRAPDNEDWLASAEKQQLNLLATST